MGWHLCYEADLIPGKICAYGLSQGEIISCDKESTKKGMAKWQTSVLSAQLDGETMSVVAMID